MIDPWILTLFVGSSLALLVTPGPAVLYVVTRSAQHGRLAGFVSCLGLTAGGLVHVAVAVSGIGVLLASAPAAYDVLRWAGAGYLVWLGLQTLRARPAGSSTAAASVGPSARRLFVDGLLVNLLNPKAAVFFAAFLPQFVDPQRGPRQAQLALLGGLFLALGFLTDNLYSLAAAAVRGRIGGETPRASRLRLLAAAVYFGLGIAAAVGGRRAG